ncbi:glycosyltransferase [Candidatus Gottesmanbacteria bacterium]|nr:glycosyltransferase [Candidatus Gottesmanbacteria bacterium]
MKIVHIIPTFNEKENIGKMIEALEALEKEKKWDADILIVDDHSPDGTAEEVKKYQGRFSNVHLLLKKKEGLGRALIMGYEYAIEKLHADVVIPNDADFQWDPQDMPKLISKIQEGYDVVVASRHVSGGKVIGWNWFRKLNHEISNTFLAWWVAGVHEVVDHAGNFKAIRVKGILDKVALSKMKNSGFSFQLHVLYELSKTGARFTEVPSIFKERKFGKSKIGFNRYYLRDVLEYIRSSISIRIERSNNFFKYVIVGGTGFIIQLLLESLLITFMHFEESNAVALGAEAAIISNFILNNVWTFSHKRMQGFKMIYKFMQFNIVSVGSIIIQKIVIQLGTNYISHSLLFVLVLNILTILILIIPYSYFVYNRFIWKTHKRN